MKYCPKCGIELEDTAKFCQKCGTRQIANAEAEVVMDRPIDPASLNGERKYDQADFRKGLTSLSKLKNYPDSPNINIKIEVMDAGFFWENIEVVNGWKLQRNKASKHYRILDPNKIRIAYGNEAEIRAFLIRCVC
jgi:hypothetical protein